MRGIALSLFFEFVLFPSIFFGDLFCYDDAHQTTQTHTAVLVLSLTHTLCAPSPPHHQSMDFSTHGYPPSPPPNPLHQNNTQLSSSFELSPASWNVLRFRVRASQPDIEVTWQGAVAQLLQSCHSF